MEHDSKTTGRQRAGGHLELNFFQINWVSRPSGKQQARYFSWFPLSWPQSSPACYEDQQDHWEHSAQGLPVERFVSVTSVEGGESYLGRNHSGKEGSSEATGENVLTCEVETRHVSLRPQLGHHQWVEPEHSQVWGLSQFGWETNTDLSMLWSSP